MISRSPNYWLVAIAGLMAIIHFTAIWEVLTLSQSVAVKVSLPPLIQVALNLTWALTFTWITIHLAQRKLWAKIRAFWLLVGFITYSALRLLIFSEADYDSQRAPFIIALSVIILIVFALLRIARTLIVQSEPK
jgi:hypothetical protein